jgi:hypothetical protein
MSKLIPKPFTPDPKDPMKVKRNFALSSFAAIVAIIVYILSMIKTGDEKTAAMMSAASGILIIALPTLAAPIVYYFKLSMHREGIEVDDDFKQ